MLLNGLFSCPGSSMPDLGQSLPLLNFDTKSDFWYLRPFRHLIKVMSIQKDKKTKLQNGKKKKHERLKKGLILWCQCSFAFLQCLGSFKYWYPIYCLHFDFGLLFQGFGPLGATFRAVLIPVDKRILFSFFPKSSMFFSLPSLQRPKNPGSRVALLPGKFLRVRKVFERIIWIIILKRLILPC